MVRSGETTTKTGALVFLLAGFGSFSVVHAEQFGTAEEARAMLDRAIAALNANQARALSEFNNTKNTQLHDRDLYISCYNIADGKFTAFPSRAMIGADIREMKLQNDCVGQRAYDAIKSSAEGSIATFLSKPLFFPRTYCPLCRTTHEWFAKDAWVCDPN
jgi:hypothetical protein